MRIVFEQQWRDFRRYLSSQYSVQQLIDDKLSDASDNIIRGAVATLAEYAHSQNTLLSNIEQMHPDNLDVFLIQFFADK